MPAHIACPALLHVPPPRLKQTAVDLRLFRVFAVLLLALFAAMLCRGGGLGLGHWLAPGHGMLSITALAALMALNTPW